MAAQVDSELVAEVTRILEKSFQDAHKRIISFIAKREKKLVKELNSSSQRLQVTAPSRRGRKPGSTSTRHKRDDYHRSSSAAEQDE